MKRKMQKMWKTGKIVLIFKGKVEHNPGNWKPITLKSIIGEFSLVKYHKQSWTVKSGKAKELFYQWHKKVCRKNKPIRKIYSNG
jgi:hypothetical protein